jgi:hypothetical protein
MRVEAFVVVETTSVVVTVAVVTEVVAVTVSAIMAPEAVTFAAVTVPAVVRLSAVNALSALPDRISRVGHHSAIICCIASRVWQYCRGTGINNKQYSIVTEQFPLTSRFPRFYSGKTLPKVSKGFTAMDYQGTPTGRREG